MPTERYFVVKAEVPDGVDDSTVTPDSIAHILTVELEDFVHWSVEGEWESLEAIGESLFDIDTEPSGEDPLAAYQEKNCRGCRFADDAVGTGEPCCTFPGQLQSEGDTCLCRRERFGGPQ